MIEKIIYSQEFVIMVKLLLSLVCGGVLGLEREQKKRPAGFRTYMLVCVGSALVMITNEYMYNLYPGIDPSRMGAQVISGIGFLGVGTIIVTGYNNVKGLTTAAGLWATACVGLAIGAGNYYAGIIVSVFIYIVMKFLQSLDKKLSMKSKLMNIYVEFDDVAYIGKFIKELRNSNVKIKDMELKSSKSIELYTMVLFTISLPKKENHCEIIKRYNSIEGVIYAEEI